MTSNYIDISGKKKKTAAKKTTAKATSKSAVKATKSAKPKTAPKQVKKTVKKSEAAKATKKVKVLKPDRNYENSTDGDEKIIVLNGKKARKQTRSGRKQLKRVANNGGYTAWDGRTGKTFASEKEARDYAADVLLRTGELIPVTRTQRTVTHTFKAESKTGK